MSGINNATVLESPRRENNGYYISESQISPTNSRRTSTSYYSNNTAMIISLPTTRTENDLIAEKSVTEKLRNEVLQLSAQRSRNEDELEGYKLKILRLESAIRAVTSEAEESRAETRKAVSEADQMKRSLAAMTATKLEIAASRGEILTQLQDCRKEMIKLKQELKSVKEQRDTAIGAIESMRERTITTDSLLEESRSKLQQLEMLVQQRSQSIRDVESQHEVFHKRVSAENERIAVFLRQLISLYNKSTFNNSDSVIPALESFIYENSKCDGSSYYTLLHDALRDLVSTHEKQCKELHRRGKELEQMITLDDDLNHALGDLNIVSSRLSMSEAQLTLVKNQLSTSERETEEVRNALADLLKVLHNELAPTTEAQADISANAAMIGYVSTAIALLKRAANELDTFRKGKNAMQAEISLLTSELEEERVKHCTRVDNERIARKEQQEIVEKSVAAVEAKWVEFDTIKTKEKDAIHNDIKAQRDEVFAENVELRFNLQELRQKNHETLLEVESLTGRLKDTEKGLQQERIAKNDAVREAREVQVQLNDADNQRRSDKAAPFECLLISLQALVGARRDQAAAAASAKALARLVHVTYPPKSLYRGRPTLSLLLRFRVSAIAVITANRLIHIGVTPRTAFRSGRGEQAVRLPLSCRVTAFNGCMPKLPDTWRTLSVEDVLYPNNEDAINPSRLVKMLTNQLQKQEPPCYAASLAERLGDGLNVILITGRGVRGRRRQEAEEDTDCYYGNMYENKDMTTLPSPPPFLGGINILHATKTANYAVSHKFYTDTPSDLSSHTSTARPSPNLIPTPVNYHYQDRHQDHDTCDTHHNCKKPPPLTIATNGSALSLVPSEHMNRLNNILHRSSTTAANTTCCSSHTIEFASEVLNVIKTLDHNIEASLIRHKVHLM